MAILPRASRCALFLTLTSAAAGAQTIDFDPYVSYPTESSGSWDVVAADFDGDGDQDLATANRYWHEVTVLFNDGAGTFGSAVILPVGDLPHTLVAGDLSGNGFPDIVVTGPASDVFTIIMNQGSGVFGTPQNVTGDNPIGVDLGDIDGDGDLDIAVTFADTSLVRLMINDGNGNFAFSPVIVPVGQGTLPIPTQVELEDLDGDGDLDITTANSNENTVSVALNDGSGTFAPASTFQAGFTPDKIALGDLDGDGDLDIAAADQWYFQSGVIYNQGDGSFGPVVIVGAVDHPDDVLIADLDGDGDNDIVYIELAGIAVFPNTGAASFGPKQVFPAGITAAGVTAADLDGNGSLDLAIADEAFPPDVTVLLNRSEPPCADPTNYCIAAPNSVGPGAVIGVAGSTSISANNFVILVAGLPVGEPGIFYYGPTQVQASFGDGFRCVGGSAGSVVRLFPFLHAGPTGQAGRLIDFTAAPAASGSGALTAGTLMNFQFWYRDPAAGGSAFNLSNAICVLFAP